MKCCDPFQCRQNLISIIFICIFTLKGEIVHQCYTIKVFIHIVNVDLFTPIVQSLIFRENANSSLGYAVVQVLAAVQWWYKGVYDVHLSNKSKKVKTLQYDADLQHRKGFSLQST